MYGLEARLPAYLLGHLDSNQDPQIQSLVCCHCTMPHCSISIYAGCSARYPYPCYACGIPPEPFYVESVALILSSCARCATGYIYLPNITR
jgi:hypothetical protein